LRERKIEALVVDIFTSKEYQRVPKELGQVQFTLEFDPSEQDLESGIAGLKMKQTGQHGYSGPIFWLKALAPDAPEQSWTVESFTVSEE